MSFWTTSLIVTQFVFIDVSITGKRECCDRQLGDDVIDIDWVLVQHYVNYDAPAYGNNSTTHCECRQACKNLVGCTGYDWYPYGNGTHCWVGNNCPVSLTYDVNNQHYIPKIKVKECYSSFEAVSWKLVKGYANFDAPAYGDNTTTHCECRQACIDLAGCTGYDWYPYGTGTHCWVGNNCPVTLTADNENHHYVPSNQTNCYSADTKYAILDLC